MRWKFCWRVTIISQVIRGGKIPVSSLSYHNNTENRMRVPDWVRRGYWTWSNMNCCSFTFYLALFQQIQSGYMYITELEVEPNTMSCFAHLAPNRIRPEEGLAQKSTGRQSRFSEGVVVGHAWCLTSDQIWSRSIGHACFAALKCRCTDSLIGAWYFPRSDCLI
jgi:hypothetical protein